MSLACLVRLLDQVAQDLEEHSAASVDDAGSAYR